MGELIKYFRAFFKAKVVRNIKNYNVEERAFKEISKNKPSPAPRHPSYYAQEKIELKTDPLQDKEFKEKLSKVFITSVGDNLDIYKDNRNIKALKDVPVEDLIFGLADPKVVPKDKYTLKQILSILTKYQNLKNKSKEDPLDELAQEYQNIDKEILRNIVKYFHPFQIAFVDEGDIFKTNQERAKYLKNNDLYLEIDKDDDEEEADKKHADTDKIKLDNKGYGKIKYIIPPRKR